jgi:hypothetical protein
MLSGANVSPEFDHAEEESFVFSILWIIAAVLIVLWIIGLVAHILGAAIHILLVLAVIAFIIGFLTRSR